VRALRGPPDGLLEPIGMPAAAREPQDLRASITRLAQFRPGGVGQIQIEAMLRELMLTSAYEAGETGIEALAGFRDTCLGLWGIETEIDELRDLAEKLIFEHKLVKQKNSYRLTEEARTELQERITGSDQTEGEAFADWEVALTSIAPWVEQDDLDVLRHDLDAWLRDIIVRHSIEAAMLLYPEDERGRRVLSAVEEHGIDFLPDRGEQLNELRQQALYVFLHQPTIAQRSYLTNLMTTAYMVASFTLDPRASEHVQELTKGQRIYLDTNVVYAALNLQGPQAFLSASRTLKLTANLGYELAVTRWTIDEMKHSLRDGRAKLAKTPLPPRALAEIAANATGEESFITAYWRTYKDTGVTVEDFSAMYTELDSLIERLGIAITDQSCLAVDRAEIAIDEQFAIISRVPGGAFKSDPVKLHDVKHRLLVERLRGDGNRTFANAGYWFLTRDTVLLPYGREALPHTDALPFAVSMNAWAYIVRSFTPRTEDYDQTLVDLLDTPSIRPRGLIPYQTVAAVLGRVDMLVSDSSEEIASRLLLDQVAMAEITQASPDERETVIDQAITAKTSEMERQIVETETARKEERAARITAEHHGEHLQSQLDAQSAEVSRLSEQIEAQRLAREQAEQDAAAGRERENEIAAAAAAELARTQEQHSTEIGDLRGSLQQLRDLIRHAVGGVLVLLAVAVAIIPLVATVTGWWWVAAIFAAGVLAFLGLQLIIPRKAAAITATIIALVSVAIDLHSIAPKTPSPAPKHAQQTTTTKP